MTDRPVRSGGAQPVIRVTAMPADADANAYGDIFGGWLMSLMDMGAGLIAAPRFAFIVAPHLMRGWAFLPRDVAGRTLSRERTKGSRATCPRPSPGQASTGRRVRAFTFLHSPVCAMGSACSLATPPRETLARTSSAGTIFLLLNSGPSGPRFYFANRG